MEEKVKKSLKKRNIDLTKRMPHGVTKDIAGEVKGAKGTVTAMITIIRKKHKVVIPPKNVIKRNKTNPIHVTINVIKVLGFDFDAKQGFECVDRVLVNDLARLEVGETICSDYEIGNIVRDVAEGREDAMMALNASFDRLNNKEIRR